MQTSDILEPSGYSLPSYIDILELIDLKTTSYIHRHLELIDIQKPLHIHYRINRHTDTLIHRHFRIDIHTKTFKHRHFRINRHTYSLLH